MDAARRSPRWPDRALAPFRPAAAPLRPDKFRDPAVTASGEARARVRMRALDVLWFNTGTRCNLACANCYIESSPKNDSLAYLTAAEVGAFLDEVAHLGLPTRTIGFTGGEPFLNRGLPAMLGDALGRGHTALVLTNGMRPMRRREAGLLALRERYGHRLELRVSLDHHTAAAHEAERGPGSFAAACDGLAWLAAQNFHVAIAGRRLSGEPEVQARAGYGALLHRLGLRLDAGDPNRLVLFPEMDPDADTPEITQACWGILGLDPDSVMCASSRMVVKRRDADRLSVVACTLIPHDPGFDFGPGLAGALGEVALNHPNCARFCVLGGASCGG